MDSPGAGDERCLATPRRDRPPTRSACSQPPASTPLPQNSTGPRRLFSVSSRQMPSARRACAMMKPLRSSQSVPWEGSRASLRGVKGSIPMRELYLFPSTYRFPFCPFRFEVSKHHFLKEIQRPYYYVCVVLAQTSSGEGVGRPILRIIPSRSGRDTDGDTDDTDGNDVNRCPTRRSMRTGGHRRYRRGLAVLRKPKNKAENRILSRSTMLNNENYTFPKWTAIRTIRTGLVEIVGREGFRYGRRYGRVFKKTFLLRKHKIMRGHDICPSWSARCVWYTAILGCRKAHTPSVLRRLGGVCTTPRRRKTLGLGATVSVVPMAEYWEGKEDDADSANAQGSEKTRLSG